MDIETMVKGSALMQAVCGLRLEGDLTSEERERLAERLRELRRKYEKSEETETEETAA